MLFSVDQRLLHCNVMLKRTKFTNMSSVNLSNVGVNWPDSLDHRISLKLALPQVRYNLLINSYFVINDFSDIVFFKKDSYPTWRLILEELLPPDTFTISKDCIYHLELHIQIQCKNINIYPDKV